MAIYDPSQMKRLATAMKPQPAPASPAPVASPTRAPVQTPAPMPGAGGALADLRGWTRHPGGGAGLTPPTKPTAMPMTPLPGGAPGVAGAAVSQINPAQDLRHAAITPDNAGAPNLTELAAQKYGDFAGRQSDLLNRNLRAIGGRQAAMGRVGYGPNNEEYRDIADVFSRNDAEFRRALASDVARGDLDERRSQRGELRGERDYQTGLDREAQDRAIQRTMLEDALTNSEFNRQYRTADLEYGAGTDRMDDASGGWDDLAKYLYENSLGRPQQPQPTPVYTPPTPRPTTRPRMD